MQRRQRDKCCQHMVSMNLSLKENSFGRYFPTWTLLPCVVGSRREVHPQSDEILRSVAERNLDVPALAVRLQPDGGGIGGEGADRLAAAAFNLYLTIAFKAKASQEHTALRASTPSLNQSYTWRRRQRLAVSQERIPLTDITSNVSPP
jgi:hypothetical protein